MKSDNQKNQKLGYSIREACEVSSLGRSKIYTLLADPDCPLEAIRIGGRRIILAESLNKLISGQE